MKKLRILALMHESLVPPDGKVSAQRRAESDWKTEYDVVSTLRELGHEVRCLGIGDELAPIKTTLDDLKPHVAFNLLEEFRGITLFDQHVVSYLELQGLRYTGCNPRGLTLARDKALAKKVLHYHRVPVPAFAVFTRGRKPKRPLKLRFPLFVKSLVEEASLGIAQASIVDTDEKLRERVELIHERVQTDAIVEEYIEGRELYVGVLGSERLQVFPTWELSFGDLAERAQAIATRKVKWDRDYQKRHGITSRAAELSPELHAHVARLAKRIYRALSLSGYARLDFRMRDDGQVYLLEANPNPDIAADEDFADSARAAGLSYDQLLQRIVRLGVSGRGATAGF